MFKSFRIKMNISMLQSEKYERRHAAIRALKELDDGRVADRLISILEQPGERDKKYIGWALGEMGDKRAIEPLIKALNAKEHFVQLEAVTALGKFQDERAYEALVKEMQDTESNIRFTAVEALGKLGDKRAVEPLILALADEDASVRYWAAWALDKLGDTRWKDKIKGKDEDFLQLGKIRETVSYPALIKALDSKKPEIREKSAQALGLMGDARAIDPLLRKCQDKKEYTNVRSKAVRSLGEIGDSRAADSLKKLVVSELEKKAKMINLSLVDDICQALKAIAEKQGLQEYLVFLSDVKEKMDECLRRKDEERQADELQLMKDIQELIKKIRVGMSLNEVKALLGPPSSSMQGGSVLGMFGSVTGSAKALSSLSQRQYYVWRRPEGEWKLVFTGNKLVDIYQTP